MMQKSVQERVSDSRPVEGGSAFAAAPAVLADERAELAGGELARGITRQLEEQNTIRRVAIAQIKPLATRLEYNYQKITDYIERALAQNVDLVTFPELSIPGYLALDNFKDEAFVQANLDILERVVKFTEGKPITVVVGFVNSEVEPETGAVRHYNAAAVIRDGKLLDVVDKTLLPDYDIFWENRYFKSSRELKVVPEKDKKLGVEICEDLWDEDYSIKVNKGLKTLGADLLINLSASPFEAGKYRTRFDLVSNAARNNNVPFLYANMVGAQDGYEGEVVFDGRSMIVSPDGNLLALGKKFEEELIVADLHKRKKVVLPDWAPVEETYDALVMGIKDYCARNGFKRVYLGQSGGIDSAVVLALAVAALGPENVIAVTMPSKITSQETLDDALLVARNHGVRCDIRPIGEIYEAYAKSAIATHGKLEGITKQNLQARIRGNILMEYTNQDRQGMVLSTGNKTELGVGYCTLYGDMSGGLALIADQGKTMVYELASYVNTRAGKELIPESTIKRAPTAELEPGQTDEAQLPARYSVLSPLVDELVEGRLPKRELMERYPEDAVRATSRLIRRNEFKRRQAAPGVRTSGKAFGSGRRFPVDDQFDELSFSAGWHFREEVRNAKDWITKPQGGATAP